MRVRPAATGAGLRGEDCPGREEAKNPEKPPELSPQLPLTLRRTARRKRELRALGPARLPGPRAGRGPADPNLRGRIVSDPGSGSLEGIPREENLGMSSGSHHCLTHFFVEKYVLFFSNKD